MIVTDKFWSKVRKTDTCWIWIAGVTDAGYGRFNLGPPDYERILAHRHSWILVHGAIPDGLKVLHQCDNPPCVNPSHLFLGTQQVNLQDMMTKGRHRFGAMGKGESHSQSKLTLTKVESIRSEYVRGVVRMKDLADKHNVSIAAIGYALNRSTWNY